MYLRRFEEQDLKAAAAIWNEVVDEGTSFPGDQILSEAEVLEMFQQQTEVVCAIVDEQVAGLYILHPNNIGRCSHIANASYGVKKEFRGKGIGRVLVKDSLERAKENQFKGLQFNAVVASNSAAIRLYLSLGFAIIGTIKDGYRLKDNTYVDTLIFLKTLS